VEKKHGRKRLKLCRHRQGGRDLRGHWTCRGEPSAFRQRDALAENGPVIAGRGGLGAVDGAKNLKAVVVRDQRRTHVADRESISRVLKERYPYLKKNTAPFKTLGTPFLVNLINSMGLLGNAKQRRGSLPPCQGHQRRINERGVTGTGTPPATVARWHAGNWSMSRRACMKAKRVKMPEYETLYAFGSMMDNRDLDSVIEANHLCSLMGMDTISWV